MPISPSLDHTDEMTDAKERGYDGAERRLIRSERRDGGPPHEQARPRNHTDPVGAGPTAEPTRFLKLTERASGPTLALAIGLLYALLAEAITLVGSFGNNAAAPIASFWPAAGITVVALLYSPRRRWVWLLAGIFAAEVTIDFVQLGVGWGPSVGWGLANCVEPSISAVLLARFVGVRPDLARRDHLGRFALCAVVAGPGAGALVTGLVAWLTGSGSAAEAAVRWFIGDSVGVMVVAPIVLALLDRREGGPNSRWMAAVVVLVAAGASTFAPFPDHVALPYMILPAVVWMSLRQGHRAAAEIVALIAVIVNTATVLARGPFAEIGAEHGLLIAQAFLGTTAFCAFTVAALASELIGRSEAEARLRLEATHDSLTGLSNRALLLERLDDLQAAGAPAALVFVDVDDFKDINDTYGHAAGDELLRMLSTRLVGNVRQEDLLARLGGDEFALLLEGDRIVAVEAVVTRLIAELGEPFQISGETVHIGASFGIATAAGATSPADLLRSADVAMYQAKFGSKGGFAVYEGNGIEAVSQRTRTAQEVQAGLDRGEFTVHYQPVVDLASGRMVGVEALARWRHPQRGLLLPGDFVPVAERTGAIVPLGAFVLSEACRQAAEWQETRPTEHGLTMAVNISARQLASAGLVETVSSVLAETGLRPSGLTLELTETGVLASPADARRTVRALRNLGVSVAIDDFGTGYASLTYLQRLAADSVKIDQSFVEGLGSDPGDTAIVSAVIGLVRALGLTVTAEGVETAEQLDLLRQMGCHRAQGYYLSRPLPAELLDDDLAFGWWRYSPPAA